MKSLISVPLFIFCSFFLACSNDDKSLTDESGSVQLSFGPILQDLVAEQRGQASSCAGAVPAFAELIVSQEGEMVAGTPQHPLRIKFLQDKNGVYYTEESPELSLDPGVGILEHFTILDKNGEVIWLAPKSNSDSLSNRVKTPLPMQIRLDVGGPQYVGVEVVCYEKTQDDEAGSLGFTTSQNQGLKFCIMGAYCDENGRQAEAIQYEVSAWTYSGNPDAPKGSNLYSNELSPLIITDNTDGTSSQSAQPLCIYLPDSEEDDQYYLEIVFNGELIRSGVISEEDVRSLYSGDDRVDDFHFREGNCNLGDSPELF